MTAQDPVMKKLKEHDRCFDRIEKRLDETLTKNEFYTYMDSWAARFDALQQEHLFLSGRVDRIEVKVGVA